MTETELQELRIFGGRADRLVTSVLLTSLDMEGAAQELACQLIEAQERIASLEAELARGK